MSYEVRSVPTILKEEKNHYVFDCSAALWASDKMHDLYHSCKVPHILNDADFVIETDSVILLVEYKNATIPEAIAHAHKTKEYNPSNTDNFEKIVRKFFDSLPYLYLCKKSKPIRYVFVVEYAKGDTTSRKMLRNRLQKRLPYKLQLDDTKLIEAVDVLNIEEWNNHEYYGQFPIVSVGKADT